MNIDQKQKVHEVGDYDIVRSSNGDALVCFVGRVMVSEAAVGRMEADTLMIDKTANGSALKFINLTARQREVLERAGEIYLARVLDKNITYSIVKLTEK